MTVLRQQKFKRSLIYLLFVPMQCFKLTGGDLDEFERVWFVGFGMLLKQPKLMAQIISGIIGIMQCEGESKGESA